MAVSQGPEGVRGAALGPPGAPLLRQPAATPRPDLRLEPATTRNTDGALLPHAHGLPVDAHAGGAADARDEDGLAA